MAEINRDVQTRLVYSKYLYWQGNEILDKSLPIAEGMAVLNYQDAAEMLLRAVADHVKASIKEKENFDTIIDKIASAPLNTKKLEIPYRSSLIRLNKARVNFKHYGLLPKQDDVHNFRRDLDSLFHKLMYDFFELNFTDLSLSDLVKHCRAKNYIKEAEKYFSNQNYEESIHSTAIAFTLLFRSKTDLWDPFEDLIRFTDEYNLSETMDQIQEKFNGIQAVLENHQLQLNILTNGINSSDYIRFKSITPNVVGTADGKFSSSYYGFESSANEENAQFCVSFVIDSALKIQQQFHLKDRFKESKRKFQVLKDADIIVYPSTKEIEVIRRAQKGEVLIKHYRSHETEKYVQILQDNHSAYIEKNAVKELKPNKNNKSQ